VLLQLGTSWGGVQLQDTKRTSPNSMYESADSC
jgi:hypothetical protein